MLGEELLGYLRKGGCALVSGPLGGWIGAVGNRPDHAFRERTGLIRREGADLCQCEPPGRGSATATSPVFDNIGHSASRLDAHPVSGQRAIPDEIFAGTGFQAVDQPFRDLFACHRFQEPRNHRVTTNWLSGVNMGDHDKAENPYSKGSFVFW
jgi:hypothetical protein